MYKFYIIFALVAAAFAQKDDEPFSIGLGVLSPSYSQTVGKENVKVNFEQKDNGFSYSVGDPSSGTNTYLNFGSAATGQSVNPAGYADANPAGYAGPNPSAYAGPNPSAYAGPNPSAYAGPNPSAYAGLGASSGYTGLGASSGHSGLGSSSGYAGPQASPSYNGFAGYQAPTYGANSGLGATGYGAANAIGGSSGLASQYSGPAASPNSYLGESARKPEGTPSQILPAGFSYHGTDGQSFLRQDSPDFGISNEQKESPRGLAEKSFLDNFGGKGPQGSGKVLVNGLVGYGSGGPRGGQRGGLPVGGYAGPEFAGLVREHGGHGQE